MPNHITTVCIVHGSPADLDRFEANHIREVQNRDDDERSMFFDLGTVIPKPACIEETESGSEADAGFYALTGLAPWRFLGMPHNPITHYTARGFEAHQLTTHDQFRDWLEVKHPHVLEKGRKAVAAFRETGFRDWCEWSIANWGTKWNSYDYKRRSRDPFRFVFEFQTANGVPLPVFERLTELFPELSFDLVSIDEGGPEYEGRFAGSEQYFEKKERDADRYRMVYGRDPYSDEDE